MRASVAMSGRNIIVHRIRRFWAGILAVTGLQLKEHLICEPQCTGTYLYSPLRTSSWTSF
jgi:hypothetical protein